MAASLTLRLDDDSNSRIVVENAVVNGNQTTILFWTWPDLGNPNSGKNCPLNFYSVTLKPGLPYADPAVLACWKTVMQKSLREINRSNGGREKNSAASASIRSRLPAVFR